MDLGNKAANNLLSKDYKVSAKAALDILNNSDVAAFSALNLKSEFIFDFIKEKILKTLKNSVNKDNFLNLFNFMKVYSLDFKDFILVPLVNFQNDEIKERMLNLLEFGCDEEKTYGIEFFIKIKDEKSVPYAKKYINSSFDPLKAASIKLLSVYGIKDEFNSAIFTLKNNSGGFEKMEAVEFLVTYGDKSAFDTIYDYLINFGYDESVAYNLLFLKSFDELIEENREDEILKIFFSILRGFPDNISFFELSTLLSDKLLDFLLESDKNFSLLLLFYLKEKIKFVLDDEAYSIDLTKEEKKDGFIILSKLESFLLCFDLDDAVKLSIESDEKPENLIGLALALETSYNYTKPVFELCRKTEDNEIILACLNLLKNKNELSNSFVDEICTKNGNNLVKAEIKRFYS